MLANKLRAGGLVVVISITNQSIAEFTGGTTATAGYRLDSDGWVYQVTTSITSTLEQWVTPAARAIDYEAKVSLVSGILTSGTTGTWLALSADQLWRVSAPGGVSRTCTFTVEIRRAGVGTVLDSATITVIADAT